jgi:hypothetical protein
MTTNAEDAVMSSEVRKQRRYRPPIFHWMEFWLESFIVRAGAFNSAAIRVPAARVAANNATGGRCPATSGAGMTKCRGGHHCAEPDIRRLAGQPG